MKDRQACREWYIRTKARQVMSIQGDSGLAIKTALLSGLRIDELGYAYNQQVCAQDSCNCDKLHIITKPNGISIVGINWIRKRKRCYLAILPTRQWESFRNLASFNASDIKNAENVMKQSAGMDFERLK